MKAPWNSGKFGGWGVSRRWGVMPSDKYTFYMDFIPGVTPVDLVSGNRMSTVISGARYLDNGDNVPANIPTIEPVEGIRGVGEITQLCLYSENAEQWADTGSPTVVDTGEAVNQYKIVSVTDNGGPWNRVFFWQSITSGSPSGILAFKVRYAAGTSNQIRLQFTDSTAGTDTFYYGTIGSAAVVAQGVSGVVTIVSDSVVGGYRVVEGTVLFNVLSNGLSIGVGPNSNSNLSINILGSDVYESNYTLPHIPSSGSTVTTITEVSEGANHEYGNFLNLQDFDPLSSSLISEGELQVRWTPGFSPSNVPDGSILNLLSQREATIGILYPIRTLSSAFETRSFDGTTTAVLAGGWDAGQLYDVRVMWGNHPTLGPNKFQVVIDGTGGAIVDFDGSFNPTLLLNLFFQNTHLNYIKSIRVLKEPTSWV